MSEQSLRLRTVPEITNEGRLQIHWKGAVYRRLPPEEIESVELGQKVFVYSEELCFGHPLVFQGCVIEPSHTLMATVEVDRVFESIGEYGVPQCGENVEVKWYHVFVEESPAQE